MDKLDGLVLENVSERIFTQQRVRSMLKQISKRKRKTEAEDQERIEALSRELKKIDERINRLYEALEKGVLEADEIFRERAQRHKARRDEVIIELAGLRDKRQMPVSALGMDQVRSFCAALRERFLDRSSNFGKEYLGLLVDEIRFARNEVTIRGSYSNLPHALHKTKTGPLARVSYLFRG